MTIMVGTMRYVSPTCCTLSLGNRKRREWVMLLWEGEYKFLEGRVFPQPELPRHDNAITLAPEEWK